MRVCHTAVGAHMTGSVVTARGFFTQVNCTLCVFLLLIDVVRAAMFSTLYWCIYALCPHVDIDVCFSVFLRLIFPLNGVVSSPAVHPGCVSSPSSCAGCDGV